MTRKQRATAWALGIGTGLFTWFLVLVSMPTIGRTSNAMAELGAHGPIMATVYLLLVLVSGPAAGFLTYRRFSSDYIADNADKARGEVAGL
jgi:hypothetical protein